MTVTSKFGSILMCGALLAGIWPVEAQAAATGSFQQTISINESVLLDVSTGSGTISIRAGAPGQVEVTGHIKVRRGSFLGLFKTSSDEMQEFVDRFESEPPVMLADGRLQVGHVRGNRYGRNVSISYEIVVPADTEVKSHTGSGSQEISGVSGPVAAGTGSGNLKLTDIGGAVSARSGSGSIIAEGIAGSFEAHSGSGKIRLTQTAPGDVVVTTGSGSSELHGVVGALRVKAGSGRIVVDGQQTGAWNLDTGSGSVRVSLPEGAAFELDAESGSGGINIEHPLTVQGRISKRHLRGTVRGGGELLAIDTGSGSIRIE
jgi:DUF4097 and DUF4098 domain-containing protein YvlB